MDGWWAEIESQVQRCLERNGGMSPAELARPLGLTESAVASVLSLLAHEGKLRIAQVDLPPERRAGRALTGLGRHVSVWRLGVAAGRLRSPAERARGAAWLAHWTVNPEVAGSSPVEPAIPATERRYRVAVRSSGFSVSFEPSGP